MLSAECGMQSAEQFAHCRACGYVGADGVGLCPKCGSDEWFKGKPRETVNATPLLCRQHVREFLLEAGRQHRPFNKFSRVSEDTLLAANAALRAWCVSRVKAAPSKGVTL